jgi:hypothetical protein
MPLPRAGVRQPHDSGLSLPQCMRLIVSWQALLNHDRMSRLGPSHVQYPRRIASILLADKGKD